MYDKDASQEENFDDFWENIIIRKFPSAKIKTKDQSLFMRLVGIFSEAFYLDMTTVIGTTIYFPAHYSYKNFLGVRTLAHEYVHMVDRKNEKKFMFEIKYLFPQILALLSVFSLFYFVSTWFLVFLAFLVFLIPGIQSADRACFEANAYTMTIFMAFEGKNWNILGDKMADSIADIIAGPAYYYACRDRQWFAAMLKDRYEGLPKTHEAFKEVKKWLQT